MCRLRNIALRDYQESMTTGQRDTQALDKVIHMCRYRLRNIAMCVYQDSVITTHTHTQTDARQCYPYVLLCFAGDTKTKIKWARTPPPKFCPPACWLVSYLINQTTPLHGTSPTEYPVCWWLAHYSNHTPTWHIWHLMVATPLECPANWLDSSLRPHPYLTYLTPDGSHAPGMSCLLIGWLIIQTTPLPDISDTWW